MLAFPLVISLVGLARGTEDDVVALDATTFDKFIETTPLAMVEFYA